MSTIQCDFLVYMITLKVIWNILRKSYSYFAKVLNHVIEYPPQQLEGNRSLVLHSHANIIK